MLPAYIPTAIRDALKFRKKGRLVNFRTKLHGWYLCKAVRLFIDQNILSELVLFRRIFMLEES